MCVIVIKPENVRISNQDLKRMFMQNPHGAGLAYFNDDDKRVKIVKGLMTVSDLRSILSQLTSKQVTIHFRLATHGRKNEAQTHPFVITKKIIDSKACGMFGQSFSKVLFHNGIISGYGNKYYSDTLEFVTEVLAEIPNTKDQLNILNGLHSHFALMHNGTVHLIGKYHSYKDLQCSNLHFLPYQAPKTTKNFKWNNDIYSLKNDDLENTWFYKMRTKWDN